DAEFEGVRQGGGVAVVRDLEPYPLDLRKSYLILGTVIERRRAGTRMGGNGLSALKCAPCLPEGRYATCPKRVVANAVAEIGRGGAAFDHRKGFALLQSCLRQSPLRVHGPKQRLALLGGNSGRLDVGIEVFLDLVVGGNLVVLPALLMESEHGSP